MRNPIRRGWVFLVVVQAVGIQLACVQTPPEGEKLSVVIVDIDTLRADHLGCYGYHRPTSPIIDRFAEESIRFAWAFAQAPNTPPSQSSIFTGLYPTTHGRIRDEDVLPEGVITLAEVMSAGGYATAGFVDGANMSGLFGMAQGYDSYDHEGGRLNAIGPKVLRWLERHDPAQPFLLLVHTYDTHAPYDDNPEPYYSMFLDGLELPSEDFRSRMTRIMEDRRLSKYTDHPFTLTPVELEYAKAMYDGGIRVVDDWFGQLLDLLRRRDILNRTIVVFISDHGDEFEEHDSVFHERLEVPVTHIPFMIRLPHGRDRRVVEETVESVDMMPTLLDLLGLPTPRFLHGRSLLPLLRGCGTYRQLAFGESPWFGRQITVADSEFHLVFAQKGEKAQLYRYRDDPAEQHDLAGELVAPRDRLLQEIHQWKRRVETCRIEAEPQAQLDEGTASQLRALGYLQ